MDPYGSSSRDWQTTEGYPQQGYPSYGEPGYNSGRRPVGYDWVEEERRLPPENGRRYVDDGARGWRDGSQQRFVSDSGWDGRFVENREAVPYLDEPPRLEDPPRNWEPAPSWKQNQGTRPNQQNRNQRNQQRQGDGNSNQSGNFNNNNNFGRGNRQGKKGKKWKNKDKHRGEWKQQQQQQQHQQQHQQQQQQQQDDLNPNKFVFHPPLDLSLSLNPWIFSAGRDATRTRYQVSIRYHSSVDSNARDRGPRHLRIPSTLGGAPMEDGRGRGHHLRSVYDIASVLLDTAPAPSTSVRSGRRTGTVTTNRIARGDAFGGEALLLRALSHRGALVPLRVEAPGLGIDHGRCIVFQRQRTFVISTSCYRCPKLLPPGTIPRKAHVVGGNKVPVQKSRLVPNPTTIHTFS